MEHKVLFVDDEPGILNAFKRQLRGRFDMEIATSGSAGLEILGQQSGFAVLVSDMHMPAMNGIEFLARAQEKAPESVRLMLTGNHDQDLAVKAINQGNIFRFLNKPCSMEDLSNTLDACVAQYALITAERDLLQNTLSGSVKVLTDILSMTDPASFGQGVNLRSLIRQLASGMGIRQTWDIELAAMLGNIGAIVIPGVVMSKHNSAQPLSADEQAVITAIPEKGRDLLSNIPRLGGVAAMVLYQHKNFDGSGFPTDRVAGDKIPQGARVLKVARDLSSLESSGKTRDEVLRILGERKGVYDPAIIDLLLNLQREQLQKPRPVEQEAHRIKVSQLCPGQLLLSDVATLDGLLLLGKGNLVTAMIMDRIKNYARFVGIREPILVNAMIPSEDHEEKPQ